MLKSNRKKATGMCLFGRINEKKETRQLTSLNWNMKDFTVEIQVLCGLLNNIPNILFSIVKTDRAQNTRSDRQFISVFN